MRINVKGQVTIPANIRSQAGLTPGSDTLVPRLRGRGGIKMSTDEIMRLTRGE